MGRRKRKSRTSYSKPEEGTIDQQRDQEDVPKKAQEIQYDQWQLEILEWLKDPTYNLAVRAGRQVGKSTVIATLAGEYAVKNIKKQILVISATERQAYLLFSKILYYLHDNYKNYLKRGKDRPTKSEIKLGNGSIIRCLPTGLDGLGIRGYTTDLLIADEAAFIPGEVWPAVIPQLATTGGKVILLSTPFGDSGFFYDRFRDETYKTWHINAELVAENRIEPQRSYMKHHQEEQKRSMSELQYAQEYLGEFISDFRRIFSDELVKACCTEPREPVKPFREYYLGVDIARMGEDASTYEIIRKIDTDKFIHVDSIVKKKKFTTETHDTILELNKVYNFKKIGIDAGAGSLGVGIFDWLMKDPILKRKVIALNNRKKSLDHRGESKRRILKEDMYDNLLAMMEKGMIKLLKDEELIESLRSIQYEYPREANKKTTIKIFAREHKHTDLVEGLIRSAWLANSKHLNISITYV